MKDKTATMNRKQLAQKIRSYIKEEMDDRDIVGLTVAVVDEKGALLNEGFGFADREQEIPANAETLFPIASITKTMTALAVMQLVEAGKLDLDTPIGTYIDELSLPDGAENTITPRMLLTHHSGLHGDILYNWYLPEVSSNPLEYENIVALLNKTGTVFPPGKMHSYCNAGYALLGVLIHRVSGKNYVEYIHSEIFEPLGMQESIVYAGEVTDARIARGYKDGEPVSMPMKLGTPAGGVAISAEEAALYLQAVLAAYHGESNIIPGNIMQEMMQPQNKDVPMDAGFSIGYSWFLQNPLGVGTKMASHRGELPPYHAMTMLLPELKLGVLISQNTDDAAAAPDEMAREILRALYTFKTGKTIPEKKPLPEKKLSPEEAQQYEGIYSSMSFGPMRVVAKGTKLLLKSEAMPMSVHLIPHVDNSFSMKVKLLGFITLPIKQLKVIKINFREYNGEKYLYFNIDNAIINPNKEIKPFSYPETFKKYVGEYRIKNMKNSARVVRDVKIEQGGNEEFYILKYKFLDKHKFNIAIQPLANDRARLAGEGYFTGERIKWETENGKILMHWSGLALEKE